MIYSFCVYYFTQSNARQVIAFIACLVYLHFNLIPVHIFFFSLGFQITEQQLQDVAEQSGVLQLDDDFLSPDFRAACLQVIPYPELVEPSECSDAFIYLKTNFQRLASEQISIV